MSDLIRSSVAIAGSRNQPYLSRMPGIILIERPEHPAFENRTVVDFIMDEIEERRSDAMQDQQILLYLWPTWRRLGAFISPWEAQQATPKGSTLFEFRPSGAVKIRIDGVLFEIRPPLVCY